MPIYEKSVFINCPFDALFEPLFHAIVLTVAARGFIPRCARETEGQADPRIVRIAAGLMQSKYSIHDLSRFQGEGTDNLSRFNMPLELGMALGIRYLRKEERGATLPGKDHNWVVLVPGNFLHQKFISDLAGYDASDHDLTPSAVIKRVAGWLSLQPDFAPPKLSAREILGIYPEFCQLLESAKADALGSITWPTIIDCTRTMISRTL